MFMARRDNNTDLFHSLSNTGCKNTPVIPAWRLLAQIKRRKSLSENKYLCSRYLYLWSELFALILQVIYSTLHHQNIWTWNFIIASNSAAKHSHVWPHRNVYFLRTGQIFLFQKWVLKQLPYPRLEQMWILKSVSEIIYINGQICCCQTAGNINSDGKYFDWIFFMSLLESLYKILLLCHYYIKRFQLRSHLCLLCKEIYLKIVNRVLSLSLHVS